MSKRARAALFAVLAILCAAASASIASGYRDSVDSQLGELRVALVLTAPLEPGRALTKARLGRSSEVRELPERFLPPDALSSAAEAVGRRPAAPIPAGSYLLASHLRAPARRAPAESVVPRGRRPVEITVSGGGALELTGGRGSGRVDVVVAEEAGAAGRARVRVAARGVRLLALAEAGADDLGEGDSWTATLALTREQALELIEAENFAREVRLIPRA